MHGGVREQHRPRALGLDPQAHVPREVAGQREGGHPGHEPPSRPSTCSKPTEMRSCAVDVRPVARARERDAVAVRDVARVREDDARRPGRCSSRRGRRAGASGRRRRRRPAPRPRRPAPAGSPPPARVPAPEPGRPDARVDEHGRAAGAEQVRRARRGATASRRRAPDRAAVRLPVPPEPGKSSSSSPSRPTASTSGTSSTEPTHQRTARRRRLAVRLLPADDRVAQHADALDLGLDHVARLAGRATPRPRRSRRRRTRCRSRRRRRPSIRAPSSGDRISGIVTTCCPSATSAATRRSRAAPSRRSCGSGISSGRHDPRAERAERVDRLAEAEDARAHLAPLDVARRDVVEDHVAADVVRRLLGREPLARPSSRTTASSSS